MTLNLVLLSCSDAILPHQLVSIERRRLACAGIGISGRGDAQEKRVKKYSGDKFGHDHSSKLSGAPIRVHGLRLCLTAHLLFGADPAIIIQPIGKRLDSMFACAQMTDKRKGKMLF